MKYGVRSTLGKALLTFRPGTRRSDLVQGRPDLFVSKISIWNMGFDLLWAMPRLLFARGPGGPVYFKPSPVYFFLRSAGVLWGPLYVWGKSRVLFDRALGAPV